MALFTKRTCLRQVSWPGWEEGPTNAHDKLRKLMDLPATDDLDGNKNDRSV